MKPKIRALENMADLCKDLLTTSELHTLYTTEFDFEEYDKNSLVGESEHGHFTGEVKNYLTRLEQVLSYHKSNLDETEAASFLANPTSRKRSVDNAEALLWAKRLKVIFLRFYKKPLNKEIGTMVSALFPEDERLYDEDYIAKITKEVAKIIKKSEDSL